MKVREYLELATLKMEMEYNKAEYEYISTMGKDGYYNHYTEMSIWISRHIIDVLFEFVKKIAKWIWEFLKHPIDMLKQMADKIVSLTPSKYSKSIMMYDIRPTAIEVFLKTLREFIRDPKKNEKSINVLEDKKSLMSLCEAVDRMYDFKKVSRLIQSTIADYEQILKEIDENEQLTIRKIKKGLEALKQCLSFIAKNITIINNALWGTKQENDQNA